MSELTYSNNGTLSKLIDNNPNGDAIQTINGTVEFTNNVLGTINNSQTLVDSTNQKLNVGSTNTPVYFSNGTPQAIGVTDLDKLVRDISTESDSISLGNNVTRGSVLISATKLPTSNTITFKSASVVVKHQEVKINPDTSTNTIYLSSGSMDNQVNSTHITVPFATNSRKADGAIKILDSNGTGLTVGSGTYPVYLKNGVITNTGVNLDAKLTSASPITNTQLRSGNVFPLNIASGELPFKFLTLQEYNRLANKDPNTMYFITAVLSDD